MSLVFFDIECASVYKYSAKICAFGYVVCDEKFNITEKQDILINPKGKFHLTDGRGEHGIVLPYEYGEFKQYPIFPQVYPAIKKLLEDRSNLVFGHATVNDVRYLDLETNRFRLPPFNFEFSDSQLLYMTAVSDYTRQFGLENITKNLQIEFTPHRAADDAYATMRVVEALCKKYGCECRELGDVLKVRSGKIKNHRIVKPVSEGMTQYRLSVKKEKKARAERRTEFFVFLSRCCARKSGKLYGRVFCFSRRLEDDVELSIPLVEKIYEQGGKYANKLENCDTYACRENDDTVRTRNAMNMENLEIISLETLKELLDD